eukprot:UN00451
MDSAAIFLIVVSVIFAILIFALAFVSLVKFQHPDDKNQAYFPKFVTIIGYYVVFLICMIMPFDVSNRNGNLDFSIDSMWIAALTIVAVFLCIIVPFTFFWYENEGIDDDIPIDVRPGLLDTRIGASIGYTAMFLVTIVVLTVILFLTPANRAEIPVHHIKADITNAGVMESLCSPDGLLEAPTEWAPIACTKGLANAYGCTSSGDVVSWVVKVTWLVYLFALLSFLGWWFFSIFVGVGFISLPMDLINTFRTRPLPLPQSRFIQLSMNLASRCDALLKLVEELRDGAADQTTHQDKSRRQLRKFTNKTADLEQQYFDLERDWDLLKICRDFSNSNPLWYYLQLILGVITLCLSLVWILHICLFILPGRTNEVSGFLNWFLIRTAEVANGDFPVFSLLFYIIFVFYLMWCVIMGNYSFGLRVLIFKVYAIEVGKTRMNAFLANLWILLLCTFPLVHMTQLAFPYYSRYTSIQILFGQQIKYLRFFNYFFMYNVFLYIMLGFAALTMIVAIICPKDTHKEMLKLMDERAARKNRRIPSQAVAQRNNAKK